MDDCQSVPQIGYREFSEWLHKKVADRRIPISGSMELTMRCNLRCQHCYIPLERRLGRREKELSLPEIKQLLDEITDAGCLWMLLTGGEPLLRKDFADIYLYAKHKGLLLTLFTNGTLITQRITEFFAEWRPFNIEITLYGATQETYERVTGIPGSYSRCRRGIDLLLNKNLPLGLKTMVMTLNSHELNQIKDLASSLGVQFRFDPLIHTALDSSRRPTQFRLSPQQVVDIEKSDPARSSAWPKSFREKLETTIVDHRLYLCGAGKNTFHVDAFGQMSACLSARKPSYNLLSGRFQDGWENFLQNEISRQYSNRFFCRECSLRVICPQCPAYAELELQDAEASVNYFCLLTKIRYEMFGSKNTV